MLLKYVGKCSLLLCFLKQFVQNCYHFLLWKVQLGFLNVKEAGPLNVAFSARDILFTNMKKKSLPQEMKQYPNTVQKA